MITFNIFKSRSKLFLRLYFTINQELNVRYKHLNPLWLFENFVPIYKEDESNFKELKYI